MASFLCFSPSSFSNFLCRYLQNQNKKHKEDKISKISTNQTRTILVVHKEDTWKKENFRFCGDREGLLFGKAKQEQIYPILPTSRKKLDYNLYQQNPSSASHTKPQPLPIENDIFSERP